MHGTMHSGSGAEETAFSGGGGEEGHLQGFSAYGRTLETVTSFKYLGRVILATENNWPEVLSNLA